MPGRRSPGRMLAVLATVLIGMGCAVHVAPAAVPARPVVAAAPPPADPPGPTQGTPGRGGPVAPPVRLDIPSIGVHTPLIRLGLRRDGTVAAPPPTGAAPAGWQERSAPPGAPGAAVIVGHAGSARGGPAVFHRLAALRRGDPIFIRRADGTTARFVVTATVRYPGSAFPAADMHRRTPYPALRLVAGYGAAGRDRGGRRGSVVVHAR